MIARARLAPALAAGAVLAALPAAPRGDGAEQGCVRDAMLVFDGSGSMSEMGFNQLNEPRIFSARRAIRASIPRVAEFRRVGLIVYGPGAGDSCANVHLRFPPIEDAGPRIVAEVEALEPAGETALTKAVERAAETLDHRNRPGVVVLVTDGKETCGGSPCALATRLAADSADLTVHVIGFKVRGDYFSWNSQGVGDYQDATAVARCLAEDTGGEYIAAETAEQLVGALQRTLGCQVVGRARPADLPPGA